MRIIMLGMNYSPELTGIGRYSGEMASELVKAGNDVRVVTAPPYYPEWKVGPGYHLWLYRYECVNNVHIYRCPLYVPKKPTTLTRLLHLVSFALSSLVAMLSQLSRRPDVIITVQPTLFCSPVALFLGWLSGAKTILHVQDFELDAMFGLGMMSKGRLSRCAEKVERWLMSKFDLVSTISYSMLNRAKEKGVKAENTLFFPNWVDTDFITPEVDGAAYRVKWGFSEEQKLVLYSGNLGKKQGLEIVLEAAQLLKGNKSVQFLVVGQGAHRSELERLAKQKQLSNLHFKDLVPYEDLPELMAMADIHLVVQKKGAADAVLPSKLTSILSAGGHSLITAEKGTELGLLVEKYPGIAECVEPESLDEFVKGLNRLLESDTKSTNKVARDYAVSQLRRDAVLSRFNQDIHELCGLQYADSVVSKG